MLGRTPTRSPAERRRDAVRREILDAAWALCREEGLAGLSLRALASRLGMRAPSLYSYFESKDAIYDAMFAEGQQVVADCLAPYLHDPVPPGAARETFRAGARAWFDLCTSDPVRYQLLFQRTIPGFEPSAASYALAVAHLEALGRRLHELGVTDARHLDLWTALVTGLADQQISNDPGGQRWGRLLDEAVDLFCDHVGIPPSADRPGTTPPDGSKP